MKAAVLNVWNMPARIPTVRISAIRSARHEGCVLLNVQKNAARRNPWIWIHFRPSFSIVRMVT